MRCLVSETKTIAIIYYQTVSEDILGLKDAKVLTIGLLYICRSYHYDKDYKSKPRI